MPLAESRTGRRAPALVGVVVAILATIGAANAAATPDHLPVPTVQAWGGVNPSRLPKDRAAPISIHGGFRLDASSGEYPPALREIDFELDRHVSLSTKGLPVCRFGRRSSRRGVPIQACRDSIVGKGSATVRIAFPEDPPLLVKSNATVFYGRIRRSMREDARSSVGAAKTTVPVLFIVFDLSIPVPTTVAIPVTIHRIDRGAYGYRAEGKVPTVAGGAGSLVSLRLRIGKRWRYKGKRYSLLNARCPERRRLMERREFPLADETVLRATIIHPCKVRR